MKNATNMGRDLYILAQGVQLLKALLRNFFVINIFKKIKFKFQRNALFTFERGFELFEKNSNFL
jgi:hypothetical protein